MVLAGHNCMDCVMALHRLQVTHRRINIILVGCDVAEWRDSMAAWPVGLYKRRHVSNKKKYHITWLIYACAILEWR